MKKKYVILALCCLGILGWLLPTVAAIPPTATVDYRDFKLITLPGEITLTFIASETGSNDVNISFSTYVYNGTNITHSIFLLASETVDYDWRFINDTKPYIFIDENKTLYRFDVNYSSITVPQHPDLEPLQVLIELADQLNITIHDLKQNLTNISKENKALTENYTSLNASYLQLNTNYTAQKDVNILILGQKERSDIRYGKEQDNVSNLQWENKQLQDQLDSPWGYIAPAGTFCVGIVTMGVYNNHKQGKWPFKNQKEKHAIEHSDSGKLSSKIKDKIQKKKKEGQPKVETDLPTGTEKKAAYNETILEMHNKFGLEIA